MKKRTKLVLISLGVLTLLLVFGLLYNNSQTKIEQIPNEFSPTSAEPANLSPPTNSDKEQLEEFKKQLKMEEESSNSGSDSNANPSGKNTISAVITRFEQVESSIQIRAFAQSTADGTCTLTLMNGNERIIRSSGVEFQGSYYLCKGFTLESSELIPSGEWTAVVAFDNSKETGISNEVTYVVD